MYIYIYKCVKLIINNYCYACRWIRSILRDVLLTNYRAGVTQSQFLTALYLWLDLVKACVEDGASLEDSFTEASPTTGMGSPRKCA